MKLARRRAAKRAKKTSAIGKPSRHSIVDMIRMRLELIVEEVLFGICCNPRVISPIDEKVARHDIHIRGLVNGSCRVPAAVYNSRLVVCFCELRGWARGLAFAVVFL